MRNVKWKEHNVSNDISPNFKLVVFRKKCFHKNAPECREEAVNSTKSRADTMTLKGLHVTEVNTSPGHGLPGGDSKEARGSSGSYSRHCLLACCLEQFLFQVNRSTYNVKYFLNF